jgi:hypothetical protein
VSPVQASMLICYYWCRVSISLQRSRQARVIHHRAARAVQSSTGACPSLAQDGFVRSGRPPADLYIVTRVDESLGCTVDWTY